MRYALQDGVPHVVGPYRCPHSNRNTGGQGQGLNVHVLLIPSWRQANLIGRLLHMIQFKTESLTTALSHTPTTLYHHPPAYAHANRAPHTTHRMERL